MFFKKALFLILFFSIFSCGACRLDQSPIVYTPDQLPALRSSSVCPQKEPISPCELRRKTRGSRAGIRRYHWRRRQRHVIPSVIMGNIRSLSNKLDELAAITHNQRCYREGSIQYLTETWLTALTPDSHVKMDGFHLLWSDRTRRVVRIYKSYISVI